MVIPYSLVFWVSLLIVAFLWSLVRFAKARAREADYNKITYATKSEASSFPPPHNAAAVAQYQPPAQDHYALPTKQKEVTYCVIDGRLVDS